MKNLTPEHMRCDCGASCPSVHQLEDGRLLIVGLKAGLCMPREAWPEGVKVGRDENPIIIDLALLSGIKHLIP